MTNKSGNFGNANAKENIHVLHVFPTLGIGGMELAAARVIKLLENHGIKNSICCLKGEPLAKEYFGKHTKVFCMNARSNDHKLPFRLRKLLNELKPTVIHARNWGAWPDVAAGRILANHRIPLIFSFHGLDYSGAMPLRRRIACRFLAEQTEEIFTVSEGSKKFLTDKVGIKAGKISIIPNGVDTRRFSPRTIRPSEKKLVIGTVGSLKPVKNHQLLIHSFAQLCKIGFDLDLHIAGDGPLKQELCSLANSLNVEEHVHFQGHVRDVPKFLNTLDIFVLPSKSEAHPNALLEAMSCRLPCIASDVGGIGEVMGKGKFGLLIHPNEKNCLVVALEKLVSDSNSRDVFGRAAKKRVCQKYSLKQMTESYENLYRKFSSSPSKPRPARKKSAVVMLGPQPPAVGGMVSAVQNLCNSDLQKKYDLTIINSAKTTSQNRHLILGIIAQVKLLGRLAKVLIEKRACLIHIHTCSGFTFWRDSLHLLLARFLGVWGIWHIHGGYFDNFASTLSPLLKRALRFMLELGEKVIVLGETWIKKLRPCAPEAKWAIVPNGIEIPALEIHKNGGKTSFLFLGDLSRAKGVFDLVAATANIANNGFGGVIKIAGREVVPGQRNELQNRINNCGCNDSVKIVGMLTSKEKTDALASADCLVLPSYGESLPLSVLEGMSYGLPVIATRVGVIPDVVRDGVEGYLIEPGDIKSLQQRLLEISKNRSLRLQMGKAARARVQEKYNISKMADEISAIYDGITNRGRS